MGDQQVLFNPMVEQIVEVPKVPKRHREATANQWFDGKTLDSLIAGTYLLDEPERRETVHDLKTCFVRLMLDVLETRDARLFLFVGQAALMFAVHASISDVTEHVTVENRFVDAARMHRANLNYRKKPDLVAAVDYITRHQVHLLTLRPGGMEVFLQLSPENHNYLRG